MKKITRYIDRIRNRITRNDPAQTRTRYQVSQPYSSTALLFPPSPTRPGSLIPADTHSTDSSLDLARHRCRLFSCIFVSTADLLDVL